MGTRSDDVSRSPACVTLTSTTTGARARSVAMRCATNCAGRLASPATAHRKRLPLRAIAASGSFRQKRKRSSANLFRRFDSRLQGMEQHQLCNRDKIAIYATTSALRRESLLATNLFALALLLVQVGRDVCRLQIRSTFRLHARWCAPAIAVTARVRFG